MTDAAHLPSSGASTLRALAGSEALAVLDAVFENSSVALGVWDRDLRYRTVNRALAEINGVPADEHSGRTLREVLGPLGDDLAPLYRQVMETGEAAEDVEVTGELARAPGVVRRWRASYYPVRSEEGAILGVAATIVEITSVVRAQEAEQRASRIARAAGALLDAVFAAAPIGLAVWSTDLRFQRVNEALAAINGLPVEAHLGRRIDDVLGPHAPRIRALVEQTAATREPVLDAEMALGDDAEAVYYEASYFPVLDAEGEVTAIGAVVRDVSERHRAERDRVRLLKEAVTARAQAEAAQVRAESARRAAEAARMRTEFLARVGARMAASMDLETTLQEIATAAVPVVADWCSIVLVEADGHLRTHAVAHVDPARTAMAWELAERYPPRRDADAGAGRVIRTGEAEHLAEITPEMIDRGAVDDAHREALHELGLRSALSVPLRRPGRVLGALTLVYAESGRTFGSEDLALARALAGRASLHIHNSRLYTELSHIATTLQRSLLPRRLPDVPGMEVGTRYLPVGEYNEVGGDFYDLFPSDPGVWTALIGDVSGKGADAAAITALARHTLRAAALRSSDPAENLMLLNDTMLADATTSRFCTVSYARLRPDPDGIGVTFANGGHMPPLILRADGRLDQVEMPGSLVGALQEPVFTTREERLAPGDLLLLYTDGVTDLRTRMPRSGERQLAETLERMTGRSVEDVLAAVTDMAVRAQDGRPRDDIALLAIRAV